MCKSLFFHMPTHMLLISVTAGEFKVMTFGNCLENNVKKKGHKLSCITPVTRNS